MLERQTSQVTKNSVIFCQPERFFKTIEIYLNFSSLNKKALPIKQNHVLLSMME